MSEFTEYEATVARMAQAEEDARKSAIWTKFLRNHPELEVREAFFHQAIRFCGDTDEQRAQNFTMEGLEERWEKSEAFRKALTISNIAEEKERLVEEILDLLKKARGPEALENERRRLAYATLTDLRAQHERLTQLKQMEKKSIPELHRLSREVQAGYGAIVVPQDLTRRAFAKMDVKSQRATLKQYGAAALNTKWSRE